MFVSPVQYATLQGSPRLNGFYSLDYRSHRVGDKAECPKEQTHQRGSQLSNTQYNADSPIDQTNTLPLEVGITFENAYDMIYRYDIFAIKVIYDMINHIISYHIISYIILL